jgi:haloalkane dehalogenase
MISAEERYTKKQIEVSGHQMTYVDEGSGDPIVLLHGNPTSSYLWRNIIPHLSDLGRCIAPDLIGMGDSQKLENSGPQAYTFVEHRSYLDAFLETLNISENIFFVIHDWGSALGFDWSCRHPESVRGIAYMEAIVCQYDWQDWPDDARKIFQGFRSPAGEKLILERNYFIELVLPGAVIRELSPTEMEIYRRPFLNPGEDRRPTLTWPRQIPIDGEPQDVAQIVDSYANWLATTKTPKLFINADPGSILVGRARDLCRSWPNQKEITVKGSHFIQEDSPDEIGQAVASFIKNYEA